MMIMVLLGSSRIHQHEVVKALSDELNGYSVRHIDNDCDADKKHRNLNHALLGRHYRDTVTVVTGVSSYSEYIYLKQRRAVFCVLPGVLPALLRSEDVAIGPDFLYVALAPNKLATLEKRRVYMSPLEAFSECYLREHHSTYRGGR